MAQNTSPETFKHEILNKTEARIKEKMNEIIQRIIYGL